MKTTSLERQLKFQKIQKKLGRKVRTYWATDAEFKYFQPRLKEHLTKFRAENNIEMKD